MNIQYHCKKHYIMILGYLDILRGGGHEHFHITSLVPLFSYGDAGTKTAF